MPAYSSFKRITSEGIVNATLTGDDFSGSSITLNNIADTTITGAKIASQQVTGAKIANSSITEGKIADASIRFTQAEVTGTTPVSKGGTGLSSVGSANNTLKVNNAGNGLEFGFVDLISVNVYTGNGTWTRPSGCNRIRVQVVGGGGGGTGHGEAGGSGGYAEEYIDVTGISSVTVTVGGGGGGVNYHNQAGNGATSSFGPYLSASGGEGARRVGGHSGGRPGIGSGGNFNIYGGGGSGHTHYGGGQGGNSFFGGCGIGVHDSSPQVSNQESLAAPGTGGTGAPVGRRRGGTGRTGIVVVYNFR